MAYFFPILVLGFGGYLALRAVRALEQRGQRTSDVLKLSARVDYLESQVEAQASELTRIAEGQRFAEQLLAGRDPDSPQT